MFKLASGIFLLTIGMTIASAEDCKILGEPQTKVELLRGRVSIMVPPRAEGIADPGESDGNRSVVSVARTGAYLRVVSRELFARRGTLTDADLVESAARSVGMNSDEVVQTSVIPELPLKFVGIEPREPRRIDNLTTMFASFVEDPDGFLIFVAISLDRNDVPSSSCVGLIRSMAKSLALGSRRIDSDAGWRRLGNLEIDVPAGWLARVQVGPDFDVWHLFKAPMLGEQPAPGIGIYSGAHPSFHPKGTPTTTGRILGKAAKWYARASGEPGMDVLVALSDHEVLHIWVNSAAPGESAELRRLVETLRFAAVR